MKLREYIREMDVVKEWPLSRTTLFRARQKGLPFVRIGGCVCYKPEDLEAFFCQPRCWGNSNNPKSKEGKFNE